MESRPNQPRDKRLSEQELEIRVTSAKVGIWLTLLVTLGNLTYILATWDQDNRAVLAAITVFALATAPVVWFSPIEDIVRGRYREHFFVLWSSMMIASITAAVALDGGVSSPFTLLFVSPFLYAALSYPLRITALVGALTLSAYTAVAIAVGGGSFTISAYIAFLLLCIAVLGSWEAFNQGRRREELEITAQALRQTEELSSLRAAQQREVARFGQHALAGASIDRLQEEAAQLLKRVLRVDIAAVLRQPPGEDHIVAAAQVGLPEEVSKTMTLPLGPDSQAGYTLASGAATVVQDWDKEKRFTQSPRMREMGMKSGLTVLIKGKEEKPWGLLGLQCRSVRDFGAEDVNFMQALANILASAIDRTREESRTRHEALHDPLTGLPNRNLFLDRLGHALAQAERHDSSVAVLFLDLDQFKLVNDSLGHAAGDELLAAVAPRLQQALRPGDTVARFGGDEFAVLVEDVANERDAIRVAERIAESLTRPFILRQREHFASASIGISIATGNEEPEELMRDADAALYRAKDRGRGGYEIFDEVMRARVIDHMQTENDLRGALQRKELELHYQPIVHLRSGETVMYEALLRWHHPERGLIGPAAFIPVAEESRLIVPIGRWVIDEACKTAAAWQALHPDRRPIGVTVNLAAPQLADPVLTKWVRSAISNSGIDPSTLYLELTESTLLEEAEIPEAGLSALGGLGVKLVLDDFGTGFSSLGYLKQLPLAGIKLDRAFIENLTDGGDDAAIVHAVTEMASALGLSVCAEGVETPEQLEAVRELGCSHAQGFHFAQPAEASVVMEQVRDRVALPT
jgi:diguanylate cyclase (GGDEF)-like protein